VLRPQRSERLQHHQVERAAQDFRLGGFFIRHPNRLWPHSIRKSNEDALDDSTIESFTRICCGLASEGADCVCHRRVPVALRLDRVRPGALDFARQASSYQETRSLVRHVEHARWALEVHRSSQPRASSVNFMRRVIQTLDSRAE
jgi:hypothetical protein